MRNGFWFSFENDIDFIKPDFLQYSISPDLNSELSLSVISKTWTNFLTFADKGDYTVTLVTDYDEATGECTSISNTIEYTIE